MNPELRRCSKCNIEKPLTSEFFRWRKDRFCFFRHCNKCAAKSIAKHNITEAGKESKRKYNRTHPVKRIHNTGRRLATQRHAEKYSDRIRARQILSRALKNGIIQSHPCEICGLIPTEGHHIDYSKPLEVIWLCIKHHGEQKRLYP